MYLRACVCACIHKYIHTYIQTDTHTEPSSDTHTNIHRAHQKDLKKKSVLPISPLLSAWMSPYPVDVIVATVQYTAVTYKYDVVAPFIPAKK